MTCVINTYICALQPLLEIQCVQQILELGSRSEQHWYFDMLVQVAALGGPYNQTFHVHGEMYVKLLEITLARLV